jgi:hypothetical protein
LLDAGAGVDGGADNDGGDFADVPVDLLLCHSKVLILDGHVVRAALLKVVNEFLVKETKKRNAVCGVDVVGGDGDGFATIVAFDAVGKSMTEHKGFSVGLAALS